MQTEEDDNEQEKDEEKMDTSVEEKSPAKEAAKTEVKDEGRSDGDESKIPETKEASEIKPLQEEKTVKSDAESSEKDSCKVEGAVSVSSHAVENKENETKGDDK